MSTLRLAIIVALLGLNACQTPKRGFQPIHETDPQRCRQVAAEERGNADVIVDMQPDGSCIIAHMLV